MYMGRRPSVPASLKRENGEHSPRFRGSLCDEGDNPGDRLALVRR